MSRSFRYGRSFFAILPLLGGPSVAVAQVPSYPKTARLDHVDTYFGRVQA